MLRIYTAHVLCVDIYIPIPTVCLNLSVKFPKINKCAPIRGEICINVKPNEVRKRILNVSLEVQQREFKS